MRRLAGLWLAVWAGAMGAGLVGGSVYVGSRPGADTPVVCVLAAAAADGQPVPYPHAWQRRCDR